MKISTSINNDLMEKVGVEKLFSLLSKAGFDALNLGLLQGHNKPLQIMDAPEKEFDEYYKNVKAIADKYGIEIGQTHAFFPCEYETEERFNWLLSHFERNIRATALLGSKYTVIHPANYELNEYGKEQINEKTYRLFRAIIPFLEKYDVYNAIENMWKMRGGVILETGISTANDMLECIDKLKSDRFVTCLDSGHFLNVGRNLAQETRRLGKTIKVIHIHDNRWMRDSHDIPLFGEIDWKEFMLALKEVGYEGNFNMEGSPNKYYNAGGEEMLYEYLCLSAKSAKVCLKFFD